MYAGDTKKSASVKQSAQDRLSGLKEKLKKAVEEENFEYAVKLRDEIRAMEG